MEGRGEGGFVGKKEKGAQGWSKALNVVLPPNGWALDASALAWSASGKKMQQLARLRRQKKKNCTEGTDTGDSTACGACKPPLSGWKAELFVPVSSTHTLFATTDSTGRDKASPRRKRDQKAVTQSGSECF